MSIEGGPRVLTSGLAMYLDTTNPKSYPGSGTVWNDLAQGLTFNSSGTLNQYTYQSGVQCLHFNGSGNWVCGTDYDLVDMAGDFTLEFWFLCENATTRRTIFEKKGTTYNSYEQELACTLETSEYISYYSRHSSYGSGSTAGFTIGEWNQMAIKMSSGKTSTVRTGFRSKNGGAFITSWSSSSSNAIIPAEDIRVGTGYSGTVGNGYISIVRIYNKMLNNAEILENYNATKERFGL